MELVRLYQTLLGLGIALFLFLATFCAIEVDSAPGRELLPRLGWAHLTLFEHENHTGKKYHQEVGPRCYNLPKIFDGEASSLQTHHRCVKVCVERGCKKCLKMQPGSPGHFDLHEIGLNDAISSFTQC